jgi:UTP--glucose-1-phosphate uridylyltransferase
MMQADGQPPEAIAAFQASWRALVEGHTGLMPETTLTPASGLPTEADVQEFAEAGRAGLGELAIIRLNGGLGTSMGLDRAKSLLPARAGRTFLEVIAARIESLRSETGTAVPLVLMDSFRTRAESVPSLERRPGFVAAQAPVPISFLQHRVPKVLADGFAPAPEGHWDDAMRWCPPGHGDIYLALHTSGTLDALLSNGFRYAFVANADNLGANPDAAIYGWMRAGARPFVMEVCRRTAADAKGGHLACDARGQLVLREVAQCPDADLAAFQDTNRHTYFNTNNIWLDLAAVRAMLDATGCCPPLPLIRNSKHLDPTDPTTPRVFQLEAAMGAAIAVFEGASAIEVGRARFLPVKTVADLLRLRSDLYEDRPDGSVVAAAGIDPMAVRIDLDRTTMGMLADFEAHFPVGAPSLREATSLIVRGDVVFGRDVVIRGAVVVDAGDGRLVVPDGTVLVGA